MKNIKVIITALCISMLFSCEKETTDNVSKVFSVPYINIKNGDVISIPVGTSYTDAGAEYTGEEGTTTPIQAASNTVNTTKPGLYLVTYSQTSTSGAYETVATRYVAVTSVNDPVDYSGTYLRQATNENAFVTKVGNGMYSVQNPGGAAVGRGIVIYYVETALHVFEAPPQPTVDGPFAAEDISFTATGASWRVDNEHYGTALRFFVKQ
ncbi:DUF5011 domain-containing protein [Chitinophagaceae bacterium LB-8]|uniref:DUF5011 domain-containing protein n=1 Tax=Paraflavisolibacter caeni TaxID=2982496 RepID=A0A9X2Y0S6_9BACT|nr:immunoglobulin-like domain-containing protein [Paraflavisolibacter caeni]MCU7552387.1 DUF5011 domain-containing protein [Paraflavisolibacter caeni]